MIYVYFFTKFNVKWSENSVRFEKSYYFGNWLPDGPNSVRFYLSVRYGMYEVWLCHRKMPPKGVNRMTNSVDPDQTALVLNLLPRPVCLTNLIDYAKHFFFF